MPPFANSRSPRVGEGALLVSEELRFQQFARDRGAVHLEHGLLAPGGELVDPVRDELLPGAALPFDEHTRGVALRDLVDDRVDRLHRLALPAHELPGELLALLLAVVLHLASQTLRRQLAVQHEEQLFADGLSLGEVIARAEPHGLDRRLVVGLAGEHHDDLVRPLLADPFQHLDSAEVGHEDRDAAAVARRAQMRHPGRSRKPGLGQHEPGLAQLPVVGGARNPVDRHAACGNASQHDQHHWVR